ncbi:Aste57867_11014 [Aphanomyces stellatus]|uniref:Aste57867_11014 protein n=1 Tax=Aphanomyces stellatus TaxID=120398 RepID=A0A485KTK1_9STRA|nr:hypothetical protein As57867_010973 [Aphanomyces stellatus]VFT87882.1 Aste57867_11014 [Aphanomyces stellatus]
MLGNESEKRRRLSSIGTASLRSTRASTPPSVSPTSTAPDATFGLERKYVIHVKDVDIAKKALNVIWNDPPANAPLLDEDGDAFWGPVVLCEATTWKDFERWLNVNEGRVRRWVFESLADGTGKGRVTIYSIPSHVHYDTAGEICGSNIEQIQRAGNDFGLRDHDQEPDYNLTPAELTVGGAVLEAVPGFPFPNVIIEVTYKNERLPNSCVGWITLLSKLRSESRFDAGLRRVAILHPRGQPVQEVEFGHAVAPPLTISFPLASIYAGVALPAALAGLDNPQISID